jgi:putative inorganic carbon (hco3(-)) transporter
MVVAAPLLVAAVVGSRQWWTRFSSLAAVLLTLLTQLVSYTRAGWLGMMAQGVFFGLVTTRRRLLSMLAGCLLFAIGLLALSQAGYQRSTIDPWTLNARLAVWKLGMGDIIKHPLVGVGYGSDTFMKRFAGYPETAKANGPHSAFLMVAMGSGIPALIFLLWIFVACIHALMKVAKIRSDPLNHAVTIAVAVMIVGFITRNLFDYMFAGSLAYLFWILVATGLARETKAGEKAGTQG